MMLIDRSRPGSRHALPDESIGGFAQVDPFRASQLLDLSIDIVIELTVDLVHSRLPQAASRGCGS